VAVLVAPAGLGELPDGQGGQAHGQDPEEEPARRLLGDRLQGAGLVGLGAPAEGDPDGQVGDQQVDDPVGDQADPAEGLDRPAVGRLLGRPLRPSGLLSRAHPVLLARWLALVAALAAFPPQSGNNAGPWESSR
jgi:hypothetical protein